MLRRKFPFLPVPVSRNGSHIGKPRAAPFRSQIPALLHKQYEFDARSHLPPRPWILVPPQEQKDVPSPPHNKRNALRIYLPHEKNTLLQRCAIRGNTIQHDGRSPIRRIPPHAQGRIAAGHGDCDPEQIDCAPLRERIDNQWKDNA